MKHWAGAFFVGLFFLQVVAGHVAFAQQPPSERGLFVTPPRQYLAIEAGKQTEGTFTVGNTNDLPMQVTLSVEQFSVVDYTYDYVFSVPREKWVSFSDTTMTLASKESQKVTYTITPPADAAPGGHYFTLFASATLQSGKQIRAAHVLYVTIGGEVVRSSEIVKSALPTIWMGGDIPVEFDAKNMGNTHFLAYVFARANGWWREEQASEATHVLLPQAIRRINLTIPSPVIPGVYAVTLGYKTEDGQTKEQSRMLVYLPVWAMALIAGLLWLAIVIWRRNWRLRRRVVHH